MSTMKRAGVMLAFMSLAMMANDPSDHRTSTVERDPRDRNDHKKCFRKGCNKNRTGNKLYCSAECCKLDKTKP